MASGHVGYSAIVSWTRQSGRGGLGLLVVIAIVGLGAFLAWQFVHQQPAGPAVSTSPAKAASAEQKVEAFATAQAQARQSGRSVRVAETFDDSELSSLANEAAQARAMPVDHISLHATSRGTIQGRARTTVAGQTVPVSLEGVPVVKDNRVALNVTSTNVGSIPLPGAISDQIADQLRQPLALGTPISGFEQLQVSVTEGRLTVSGVALPS